jgi:transposase
MDVIYECVCGLDIHSASIQACVRRLHGGRIEQEVRSFKTMTRDILSLGDWLASQKVSHVAMESTGVYWKPIYNILEGRFEILLVNANHVKHVPGRKTDVKDCQWLAQLLQCGLLKGSFIPHQAQRELRDLTRHRAQLVAERSAVANRIHKTLEDANIKLGVVASDILGVSGRKMLRELIDGRQNPDEMAELACRRLRNKIPELRLALEGHVREHHRFLLKELLDQLEDLEHRIERFSRRIEDSSGPFELEIQRISELPGFDLRSAQNVVAEIGTDMSRFATANHLASWAGMCPGSNESAGKRKSGKTTKGSRWLRASLVQSAWAASHTKYSYFRGQFHRLAGRRGRKRALVAVGHSLLVVIYNILLTGRTYSDLGVDYFDKLDSQRIVKSHVKRLERLGYKVTLAPLQSAA